MIPDWWLAAWQRQQQFVLDWLMLLVPFVLVLLLLRFAGRLVRRG